MQYATDRWNSDAVLRGFSCPQEGTEQEFVALVAGEYARSVARLILEAHADRLEASSTGLGELLGAWVAGEPSPNAGWDSSFGDAFVALQGRDDTNILAIAVRMALHLGVRGLAGDWSARITRSLPLRWGPWLLPRSERIAVESDGHTAEIRVGGGQAERAIVFVQGEEGWVSDEAELLPRLGSNGTVVLPRHALTVHGFDELIDASVESIEPKMVATLERAIEIIANHAPAYLPWVEQVVHEVFLIRPKLKYIQSGSIANYFGLVHVSASPNAVAIAELLVHEASHQYFHLLCLLDPFDDGTDRNMYYSPAVRKNRSLPRIGVAYHAFANILLFYDACLASGLEDGGYCRRNSEALAPKVVQLKAPLQRNDALTRVGRALCEPLIERLSEDVDGGVWPDA